MLKRMLLIAATLATACGSNDVIDPPEGVAPVDSQFHGYYRVDNHTIVRDGVETEPAERNPYAVVVTTREGPSALLIGCPDLEACKAIRVAYEDRYNSETASQSYTFKHSTGSTLENDERFYGTETDGQCESPMRTRSTLEHDTDTSIRLSIHRDVGVDYESDHGRCEDPGYTQAMYDSYVEEEVLEASLIEAF